MTMLDGLLDADFTWITADGKVFRKADALKALDNPPAVRRSLLWPAITTGLATDGCRSGALEAWWRIRRRGERLRLR